MQSVLVNPRANIVELLGRGTEAKVGIVAEDENLLQLYTLRKNN